LIPRQETEELLQWVISENMVLKARILDIGTGSGCMAVVLAKFIENSVVDALDISIEALETAKRNATANGANVRFIEYDILGNEPFSENITYDIIVSNPPYVRESEKDFTGRNVTGFEPHEALFVSDEDPFIFYKAIAAFGKRYLCKGGTIYVEINEAFGSEMKTIFLNNSYQDVILKKDIHKKDRMLRAKLI
jgi:release factor glutamine methyltransferase